MIPSTRTMLIITGSYVLLFVLFGIFRAWIIRDGQAFDETSHPRVFACVKVALCGLLVMIGFTATPWVIRSFVAGQVKIGNGDHGLVSLLRNHETPVILAVWAVFTLGWLMAAPFIYRESIKESQAQPAR
jgi:hypothetical protein